MPDLLGCNHMTELVTAIDVNEFLGKLSLLSGGSVNWEELTLDPVDERLILVSDFEIKDSSLLSIIGLKKCRVRAVFLIQVNDTKIEKADKVFVLDKKTRVFSYENSI